MRRIQTVGFAIGLVLGLLTGVYAATIIMHSEKPIRVTVGTAPHLELHNDSAGTVPFAASLTILPGRQETVLAYVVIRGERVGNPYVYVWNSFTGECNVRPCTPETSPLPAWLNLTSPSPFQIATPALVPQQIRVTVTVAADAPQGAVVNAVWHLQTTLTNEPPSGPVPPPS